MSIINTPAVQQIILKLGWTLLHFLWQGFLVALLLTILLHILRKKSANTRYLLCCSALLLMVLLPLITIQYITVSASHPQKLIPLTQQSTGETSAATLSTETPDIQIYLNPTNVSAQPSLSLSRRVQSAIEPFLPYAVLGWLVGVFGFSLWRLGGWTCLQRLKYRMIRPLDRTIYSRFEKIADAMSVRRVVRLMESALVGVPTVIGWLKPIILLPTSALTGLSSKQLDAILAHELAHIKRFDYLVNIFQTVVEILGFYHPAVWSISHKIRTERENCCDDLAVRITGNRLHYARALTSMEQLRHQPQLAVAASGGSLFSRIRRLLGKEGKNEAKMSWLPSVIAILLIAALLIPTALALNSRAKKKPDLQVEAQESKAEDDTNQASDERLKIWLQSLVEDFFENNYKDITARKTVEWGNPTIDSNGNMSIRYKYEMIIWDKDKFIANEIFTFDKYGKFLKVQKVEGFPKPLGSIEVPPEDVSTKESVQKLVEKFFSRNYRDITSRKTLEWGELNRDENGNVSIRYKYEATIWDTDKVINDEIFTFDKNGKFISVKIVGLKDAKDYKNIDPKKLGITVYTVNKTVSSFPETVDFSLPENTYVIANRIIAAGNDPAWPEISELGLAARMRQANLQQKTVAPKKVKQYLNAKIIEVYKKGNYASVIAKFPGILPKYDTRSFKNEGGKWFNKGNSGASTLSSARAKVLQGIDYYNTQEQLLDESLKASQAKYKQAIDNPDEIIAAAQQLFENIQRADYEKILSYYENGKWRRDGWKKLDLDYRVYTDWPSLALWICRNFRYNPITSVELGEVYLSEKEVWDEQEFPTVPYRLTLFDHGIIKGELPFEYQFDKGRWYPFRGIDWHLQDEPIKWKDVNAKRIKDFQRRFESAKYLSELGKACLIYANDFEEKYPDSIEDLTRFLENKSWLLENVEYLGKGKSMTDPPQTVIAYDKTLLEKGEGTNVVFNDFHVSFHKSSDLKEMGITGSSLPLDDQTAEEFIETEYKFIDLRVVDEAGKPVSEASVFRYFVIREDDKPLSQYKLDENESGRIYENDIFRYDIERDGILLYGLYDDKLAGFIEVSDDDLDKTLELTLHEACNVRGSLKSPSLEALGQNLEWTYVNVYKDKYSPLSYSSTKGKFQFFLPPGTYWLKAYGRNTYSSDVEITIETNQKKLDVNLDLPADILPTLMGKTAPELSSIKGWLNSKPLRLSDLKGKVVLLGFWGHWSRGCILSMPQLAFLHDEFSDHGLVIIGIHDDSLSSVDELEQRLETISEETWGGWSIPFATALDGGGDTLIKGTTRTVRGATTAAYGIQGWPTYVLIDKAGNVVKKFHSLSEGAKTELQKLLGLETPVQVEGDAVGSEPTSEEVILKLIDNARMPVAGAQVGTNVRTRDEKVLNSKLSWSLSGREKNVSDEDGKIVLTKDILFPQYWNPERRRALYILNEERQIGAFCEISKDDERNQIELRLEPVCHVHGKLSSEDLEQIGRPLKYSGVYLSFNKDSHGVLNCMSEKQQFDFWVPPGEYELFAYGSGDDAGTKTVKPIIEVKTGQSELDLGVVDLPATKLSTLIGKSAPEIGPIRAWKNGSPVTLTDLIGKAVIIYFNGTSPSTSRDLPLLVDLHNQFEAKGLIIIALYNCPSMEALEAKWIEVYKKYGGVQNVPFRVAVDGGESTFYEGTDKERLGATYGKYDITANPTTILIDPEGKIVGVLNLFRAREVLEKMLGVKPQVSGWRQVFDEVYRLEDGQVLKRIPPPFIPERNEYYKYEHTHQAMAVPEPPDYFTFHWDGQLSNWGLGFTSEGNPLSGVLRNCFSIGAQQFEGPQDLLDTVVPGDWIVLKSSTFQQRLEALEDILVNELDLDIRFVKRSVQRDVIEATGDFEFTPPANSYTNSRLIMYSDKMDSDSGSGGSTADTVAELLEGLAKVTGIQVIDRAEPKKINLPYDHNRSSYIRKLPDGLDKQQKLQLLLNNLEKQTNLKFEVKRATVEKWFVVEGDKEPNVTSNNVGTPENAYDEAVKRVENLQRIMVSGDRLSELGKACIIYANDHEEKYPDSIEDLTRYPESKSWWRENIEYLGKGCSMTDPPQTVLAYDKTLLEKGEGTNILYLDSHVSFEKPEVLEKLGTLPAKGVIDIRAHVLTFPVDVNNLNKLIEKEGIELEFLKKHNLNNIVVMNNENVESLLKLLFKITGSKVEALPKIRLLDGENGTIKIASELPVVTGFTEPDEPGQEPKPKYDYVDVGMTLQARPQLASGNNILLSIQLELSNVTGYGQYNYNEQYPYINPIVSRRAVDTNILIPDGQAVSIGGLKINEKKGEKIVEKNTLIIVSAQTVKEAD